MLTRAYSVLHVKSVDVEGRMISGVASTPSTDRVGDIVEPLGVTFKNPLPLLLFHDHTRPVGTVTFDKPTKHGLTFTAQLANPSEVTSASLKERIAEAWDSIKQKLIRGVSIGFRPLEDGIEFLRETGGLRFTATEVLELSLVTVPANQEATITTIKSLDAPHLAALGTEGGSSHTPGATGTLRVKTTRTDSRTMKTNAEKLIAFKADKDAKVQRMNALMTADDAAATLDETEQQEFDNLEKEVSSIESHIARLDRLEEMNKSLAVPVKGETPEEATKSREDKTPQPQIRVKDNLPLGQEFVRMVICKAASFVEAQKGNFIPALEIAKQRYPDNPRIHMVLKATVPAATTTDAVWAGPLVYAQNLESEFVEFLRPQTIVGRLALRRVPFNVRYTGQTNGGTAYWVGQGKPKPLTSFAFEANTLGYTKIATISVLTEETVRFSSPSAEMLVRDGLAASIIERMDVDFIDPDKGASANVSPASITNGLTPLSSAGPSADNIRTDLMNIVATFRESNLRGRIVLLMSESLALGAAMMTNALGQDEFPEITADGGRIRGIEVITSQYISQFTGHGNMIIALNPQEIFLADDGQVTVDVSREASLEMSDAPTQNGAAGSGASLVSLWQNNMIGLRAERFINWDKRRDNAVVYMDDVNWGSVGSPALP